MVLTLSSNFEISSSLFSHHYSFTLVGYAFPGQINQDANFSANNYIFFMSGVATGKALHVCVCTVDIGGGKSEAMGLHLILRVLHRILIFIIEFFFYLPHLVLPSTSATGY